MARQQDKSVLLYSGVSAPTIIAQEGGSAESYEIGDLVEFDSSGQIIVGTANDIAGIAQMDATGTAGSATDYQFIELIDFNALYTMTVAATGDASDQADVGNPAGITFASGADYLTQSAGGAEVLIYGIYPGDVGVTGGRYIIRFDATAVDPR